MSRTTAHLSLLQRLGWLFLAAATFLGSPVAEASESDEHVSLAESHFLTGILENTANGFTGANLLLHSIGISLAPAIILSGADTSAHNFLARHQRPEPASVFGVYAGYALPIVAGGGLMAAAFIGDSKRELDAANAVLQSTLITLTYQSTLKAFTGRPAPPAGTLDSNADAKHFRFGVLRGGIHYGWPSGHMMTTTAIYTSLLQIYPDNWWVAIGGGTTVAAVCASVALHESGSMHWTSDMVAGTLMGVAIGRGVGAGFARRRKTDSAIANLTVSPIASPEVRGLSIQGIW